MKKIVGIVYRVAVLLLMIVGVGLELRSAAAQTPPTLQSAVFYGGSGDQRGSAAATQGSDIYVSGFQQVGGLHGLLIKETTLLNGPVWTMELQDTHFNGLAATASTLYPVGQAEAAHFGGKLGTCGASDVAGGHERKSMFARFNIAGTFLGCGSVNYFPYKGHEYYLTAVSAMEGISEFVYVGGQAEQTGFARSFPFVLAKYDSTGNQINQATEPGITLGTSGCCPGDSNILGLAAFGGHIYAAGHSRLPGLGEDDNIDL